MTGQSNMAGDANFHAFLWDRGVLRKIWAPWEAITHLRGGSTMREKLWAARKFQPGSHMRHGFLWKNGVMTDLGTLPGDTCATAYAINSNEQIVGDSVICGGTNRGFLWENGGPMVDLQTLVLQGLT